MTTACPALPAPSGATPSRIDTTTLILVAITVLGWASAFPAIRLGLTGFGPLELGALRFGLAAIPAAIFLAVTRPALPGWRDGWRFAFGGVVFVALYTVLLNLGQQTVPAAAASFIINVNPILTALLAMAFLNERFGLYAWLGTALSFLGVGFIAVGKIDGFNVDSGVLLVLGATFATSINNIVQKPLFARHKPLTVAAWNIVIGALLLAPMLPDSIAQAQAAPTDALFAAIYLAVIPSFVVYGTWAMVLSRLPAARATNMLYAVPPVATLIGWLWLSEVPTTLGLIGGALALGGVVLVNVKR
ncbi:DMT family transporter [Ferrovibrio terrae]|uniref:DMT family transporter n=1 Tax=Ferrovibrio terrae TaxID=2594003 RepID=UPI003137B72D